MLLNRRNLARSNISLQSNTFPFIICNCQIKSVILWSRNFELTVTVPPGTCHIARQRASEVIFYSKIKSVTLDRVVNGQMPLIIP